MTERSRVIANLSTGGIPTDFKLDVQFWPVPMTAPKQAYYYSAIMAMKEIALEDWEGVMRERTFRTTRYPQLAVMINTYHETIPRKYVVWGLFLACAIMEHGVGFGFVFFSLQWQGREVGGLAFNPPIRSAPLISKSHPNATERTSQSEFISIDNITNRTATLGEAVSQIGLTVLPNDDRVTVAFARHGIPLRMLDVFTVILVALSHAAPRPKDLRITSTWTSEIEQLHTQFFTNQQPPSRSEPPYYTTRLLIETLALATEHIATENQYYEIRMVTKVNDVAIARSAIVHKRGPFDQAEVATA